ncbi:hypothetical protein FRC07_010121 [Ceratobasidium sp. 392]|nr:hypothetical protein FRC07_010121 [Ceratobasidium sp. 392]
MSAWTVSAIFANVSSVWGGDSHSYEALKSADVSVLLKEVDDILRHTSKLLKSHKNILPEDEYEGFKAQHRTYRWMFTDQYRSFDEVSTATDKAASQDHANKLLETVKNYRSTLLEASRQATFGSTPAFPDEEPSTDSQSLSNSQETRAEPPIIAPVPVVPTPPRISTPSQIPSRSPFRPPSPPRISKISILPTNAGLLGKLRTANAFLAQTTAPAPEPEFIEGQGFAIAVVHIPQDLAQNLYERMVYVKIGDRQLHIPDPNLHVLEPHEVAVDDKALAAAFILVGEFMLNPEKFQKTIDELRMEID